MQKKRWLFGIGGLVVIAAAVGLLWPSAPKPEIPEDVPVYVPETMPDVEREAFFVESDGLRLEAELSIPEGGRAAKPAVIFLPGSGQSHFDDYLTGFLESYVEGVFLPNDIAVLYFNKRGVGQSEGNSRQNDFQGRADDAYAAVQALQRHPAIDAQQIGVIGHSQGGWITSLVASQHDDVAFFISLAGPTTTVEEQIEQSYRNALRCEGIDDAELERKVNGHMRQIRLGASVGQVIRAGEVGFIAGILDYDPRAALQSAAAPGLLVFGGVDPTVPPGENLARFEAIFPAGAPETLSVATIERANHSFRLTDTGCEPWPAYLSLPISTDLVDFLNTWLTDQGFAEPGPS